MIYYLGGFFPDNIQDSIIAESKGNIQFAADALQKSILRGLFASNVDVSVINALYIGSYPVRYNKIKIAESDVILDGKKIGSNVSFCNLTILKNISRYKSVSNYISKKINKKEHNIIIVYAMHLPFLMALRKLKEKYKEALTICLIVPDLPEFMNESNSIFHKLNTLLVYKNLFIVDKYIVLTKYMMDKLPFSDKPYLVIEGIYCEAKDQHVYNSIDKERIIFYSGTLARRYGILNLVKAFMMIKDPDLRLVICGEGDAKAEVLNASKLDGRIICKGLLPRWEILTMQQKATLLVNPRTPEGDFTKYSFPSKTMEYFASGTPVLMYKLEGIPEEYWDYCFTIDDLSIEGFAAKMIEILNLSQNYLLNVGQSARNFIMKNKSEIVQGKKIVEFVLNQ